MRSIWRHKVLLLSNIEYMSIYLCRYNLPPLIPILMKIFQMNHGDAGILASISLISYTVMLFPSGLIGDAIDPKRVLIFGAGISAASNFAFTLTQDLKTALIIQFINGLGQGMIWGPLTRIVSNHYIGGKIELAMSALLFSSNIGPMITYVFSSYTATEYGWKTAFIYPSIILTIITFMFWILIKESSNNVRYMNNSTSIIKGTLSLIITNRNIWLMAIAYACYMFIYRSLLTWLPTYLMEVMGVTLYQASIIGGLPTLIGTITMFLGAWLTDKNRSIKYKLIIIVSFAISIPLLWSLQLTLNKGLNIITLCLIFASLNLGSSLYFAYTPKYFSKEIVGAASGFIDCIAYIGSSIGVLIIGIIYDVFLSYNPAFTLLASIAIIGTIIAIIIPQ